MAAFDLLKRALCSACSIIARSMAFRSPAEAGTAVDAAAVVAAGAAAGAGLSSSPAGGGLQPMERVLIEQALQSARFNKSKAAKVLGLTRQQLYVRLRKYGLD